MEPALFGIGDIVAVIRNNGRAHFLITEIEEDERKYKFITLQSSGALHVWRVNVAGSLHFGTLDNTAKKVA